MPNFSDFPGSQALLDAFSKQINLVDEGHFVDALFDRMPTGDKITWPMGGEHVVAEFKDPLHPAADVKVVKVNGAFRISVYDKHRGEPETSETVAAINAENLHKRLVEALETDARDRMPSFGRF